MGKVLIVDDDPMRFPDLIRFAKQNVVDAEIIMVLDSVAAENILIANGPWDMIFLDHDLGGLVYINSNEPNTGYQIAKFIADHEIGFETCVLHSMNPVGIKNMHDVLKDLGTVFVVPYSDIMER